MLNSEQKSDAVLRAVYQISGFTRSPVTREQIHDVVPLEASELSRIMLGLQSRGLITLDPDSDSISLTPVGIDCAAKLPPVSEPPLFQDI